MPSLPSFWSPVVLACIATGALWSCGSNDASPSRTDGGVPDAAVRDASPQDAGIDAPTVPKELTVVTLAPAHGDANVSVQDPIQVTFSEAVQIGATPLTLTKPDGTLIPTTAALSSDRRTVTLSLLDAQKAPAEVVAHFADISTLDGRPLVSKPDWSWKLPAWVSVGTNVVDRFDLYDECSVVAGPGRQITFVAREWNIRRDQPGFVSTTDTLHGAWKQLGGPLTPVTYYPRIALDAKNNLVALSIYENVLHVQRWSGAKWDDLGGPIPDADGLWENSPIAVDSRGKIFMAYSHRVGGQASVNELLVRSFDGTTWSPVGGPVSSAQSDTPFYPNLVLDPTGIPYVRYHDSEEHIVKWTGSAWAPVGSHLAPTGGTALGLTMAFDDGGRLFAIGNFSDGTTRVIRFDGSDWVPVGNSLGTKITSASLVAGRSGHLFSIVYDDIDNATFRVADITQAGWTKIDGAITDFGTSLAVDPDNVPVVLTPKLGVLRLNR
ncbi:Ig-like domain-containing protein [Pendulispora brunnea]|uniref:Ig-like domain-containing protein n=1 Tax=Pendulispora brunnea TaxID=2905690 RepID=A0ABZ2JZB1_9BACT